MLLQEDVGNYDKQALLDAVKDAQKLNVFSGIENPFEWQKKMRDEWE
jgi:hypothetical protein